jgi:UDP-N-acetylglucosamine 4,6-dehydratase
MKILITGGTGSLGSALVEKWYNEGHTLTITSNELHRLAALEQRFPLSPTKKFPSIRFKVADICDYEQMRYLCQGQDILIHAAALKHVGLGERNVDEYIRVNVLGTLTIARAWANTHSKSCPIDGLTPILPRKAILISSDKAVAPLNFYGGTKFMAEKIFSNQFGYSVLRYGNVVDSEGSFWQVWQNALKDDQPITVRLPDPTRFFLKLIDGIELVEQVVRRQESDSIFVPCALDAFSVLELASCISDNVIYESLGQGEKQHEILLSEDELAIPVSGTLARITRRGSRKESQTLDRYLFSSETASRIIPESFIEKMDD